MRAETLVVQGAVVRPAGAALRTSWGRGDRLGLVWRASLGLLGLQLVGMLVFTTVQYQRFDLTNDFATYAQAWTAIAHGHLSPYSSELSEPFWRNDFELLMWPLALFYWLNPASVTLLWLQVLAVAGGEVIVLAWARRALAGMPQARGRAWLLAMVTGLLLATPWSWLTIGFDFHFEAFAALFALLAARDLWAGRYKRLFLWVPLTLCCCAVAASLYVVGTGFVALLSRRGPRRAGLAMIAAGLVWLAFAASLGATGFGNQPISGMYGYLAGHASGHLGLSQLALALVEHPGRAMTELGKHAGYVAGYLASGGIVGLRSRWGLVPAAFVLLPNALNAKTEFIQFVAAFQSWAAVLFLMVGSVFVVGKLASGDRPARPAVVFGVVTLVAALGMSYRYMPSLPGYILRVSPAAATALARVQDRIPQNAEVIASQGIIGRFAPGRATHPYWANATRERFPLAEDDRLVAFIFSPVQGTDEGYVPDTFRAINFVRSRLPVRPIEQAAGIWAYLWAPPATLKTVELP